MSFRDEVDGLNARFMAALERNDAAGACADAYHDDAMLMAGPEPLRGMTAITAAIAGARSAGTVIKGITTLTAEADGNIGYTVGTVDTNTGKGIMLLALKRDDAGAWKISAEAYFAK
jgi:ketosteroid isomerase-like protein